MIQTLTRFLAVSALAAMALPGATLYFSSNLAPEAVGATGSGSVTVAVDTTTHQMTIEAIWSGTSGNPTISHIHCCVDAPGTVGVAVTPVNLPGFPGGGSPYLSPSLDLTNSATYTANFLNNFGGGTVAGAEAALMAALASGNRAYFNIHTSAFPAGEIRGFLAPVPEPATFAFAAAALGGLLVSRRYFTR